jgi:hypothetical protein
MSKTVATAVPVNPPHCSDCGANLDSASRNCQACGRDVGFPNVRKVLRPAEVEAFNDRLSGAKAAAQRGKCLDKLNELIKIINTESRVVISMPPSVAKTILSDPRQLYNGYEKQILGESRSAAPTDDDCTRSIVASALFGSFASHIRYGALSADGIGLKSYGCVHFVLRDIAVAHRVSFLECNSYKFIEKYPVSPQSPPPPGFASAWPQRGELSGIKLYRKFDEHDKVPDVVSLLIYPNNGQRDKDDFVEAHIFGGFNLQAIEFVRMTSTKHLSREDKLDLKIVKELASRQGIYREIEK